MGFNSVYRSLQDIFPQVDSRLLRAVAIEHPKDADVAAEIVLTEIIPSISKKLLSVTPPQDMSPRIVVNLEDDSDEEGDRLAHRQHVRETEHGSYSSRYVPEEFIKTANSSSGPDLNVPVTYPRDLSPVPEELIKTANSTSGPDLNVPVTSPQDLSPVVIINLKDDNEEEGKRLTQNQLVENTDVGSSSSSSCSIPVQIIKPSDSCGLDLNMALNESTLSNCSGINDETNKFIGISDEPNILQNGEGNLTIGIPNEIAQETSNGFGHQANASFDQGRLDMDVDGENLASFGICQVMETEKNHLTEEAASTSNNGDRNANHLNEEWVDFFPTTYDYDATICDTSHVLEKCESALIELEGYEIETTSQVQGPTPNAKGCLQIEFNASPSIVVVETSDVEDEIDGNKALSQYNRACSVDMLEETIDEAKTNKKTLFSSMESLINLMREVELQEKAAEQANMSASRGGFDMLDRVEQYKAMLVHAKEANDMHAGEIYGEKAILATELKELQSRLSSLSGERDKSLAILDEMRLVLESRLTAADMLRKTAEHERQEKEESAQLALLEQEAMMEKVVQESKRLQQAADENSKLREFLMDRGQIVDTLQGEISVICEDIRLLKEKFDANLPLSKSFTSSQTSCILASSGSSHKSLASNVGSEHSDSSEILKITQAASVESLSDKVDQEERSKAEHNALLDDGWDIFEKDAELDSGLC